MMKLHIQLAAVDIELPFWRALSGRISEGYTCRAKRIQNQYSCLQTSLRVVAPFDGVTYPDGGLETNSESALEDEKHSGGADACCVWWEALALSSQGLIWTECTYERCWSGAALGR